METRSYRSAHQTYLRVSVQSFPPREPPPFSDRRQTNMNRTAAGEMRTCAYVKISGLPNRARASLSAATQNPAVSVFDSRQDSCAYRLCHPNVLPMETAEPKD